jgi:hypothetical protein
VALSCARNALTILADPATLLYEGVARRAISARRQAAA